MSFWYNTTELATAVKPHFLNFLHREYRLSSVAYLDPDIWVLAPMNKVFDRLCATEMLLTPHLDQDFPEDGRVPDDAHILRSGAYNLGFLGIRFGDNALQFLRWWGDKLLRKCVIDHGKGYFVDQRFIDLAVTLFPGFDLLRDSAFNVAYWNLHSRTLTRENGVFQVNGAPLVFFHFSGVDPDHSDRLSKHQNRFDLGEHPELKALKEQYVALLKSEGLDDSRHWPYGYGHYSNGRAIHDLERKVFRDHFSSSFSADPFDRRSHGLTFRARVVLEKTKVWLKDLYGLMSQ